MEQEAQRAALEALMTERGVSFVELSRVIGRNPAYLQQYVKRGSPRELAERDRARLAGYLGVDESQLGARVNEAAFVVPRLDVGASAGPGGLVDAEDARQGFAFPPALLRQLGVRTSAASMIRVQGDSMSPTLEDGDEILVNRDDRRVGPRGGVFVLRLDDELVVKRLRPAVGGVEVVSDNPTYPARVVPTSRADVIGRVAWLSRAI
jgi:phage repressor protein C with HTH and peptisase S24 domain